MIPAPSLRQVIRALPPAAWALFAGTFINRFGSFVVPFLILYLIRQGYTAAAAGTAVGAYGVGSLAASAVGGIVADRLGRRPAIVLSMFSSAAVLVLLSQARTLPLIILLAGLTGLTAEMYRPASGALLADLVPPSQRVTAFALYRLAINAGFAIGPAAAGLLADRSFFLLFLGDALTSVLFGIIALRALPAGMRSHVVQEERGESARAILGDALFVRFLLASVAIAFVYFQSTTTFALHVRASGLSNAAYGSLISLNGLIIVFLELPLTGITQRLPPRPVIAAGMLLVGLGFGATALAYTYGALVATVVIWTLGEITGAPVTSAYVANIAPRHLRGRYQGAWGMTWGLAFILGPMLGTRIYAVRPAGFWLLCAGLGALAAGLVLIGRRALRLPLNERDAREHQRAADPLPPLEPLPEQKESQQGGHHRFHRGQDARPSRFHPPQTLRIEQVRQEGRDEDQVEDHGQRVGRGQGRAAAQHQEQEESAEAQGVQDGCRRVVPAERMFAEDAVGGVGRARRQSGRHAGEVQPQRRGRIGAHHQRAAQHGEQDGRDLLRSQRFGKDQPRQQRHPGRCGVEEHRCGRNGGEADRRQVHSHEERHADQPVGAEPHQVGASDAQGGASPQQRGGQQDSKGSAGPPEGHVRGRDAVAEGALGGDADGAP